MTPVIIASALVAAVAQPYGPATMDELVKSFDTICFRPNKPFDKIETNVAATGFKPVEVIPSQFNPETKAWRRGGIRLFETAGQRVGWPVLPTCGVSADVGRIKDDKTVMHAVNEPEIFMYDGQPSPTGSMYHLISTKGIVDLAIDKRNSSHVIVSLLWQVSQPAATETH